MGLFKKKKPVDPKPKEDEQKIEFEKELKKYPRRTRTHLRKLYEEYNKGNILEVEVNNGKVSK